MDGASEAPCSMNADHFVVNLLSGSRGLGSPQGAALALGAGCCSQQSATAAPLGREHPYGAQQHGRTTLSYLRWRQVSWPPGHRLRLAVRPGCALRWAALPPGGGPGRPARSSGPRGCRFTRDRAHQAPTPPPA